MHPTLIAIAIVLGCLGLGWGVGWFVRRRRGGRIAGRIWPPAATVLALALALGVDASLRVVGFWDAATVALLLVGGVLLALHPALADGRKIALSVVVLLLASLGLEVACRQWLGPAPRFPSQSSPSWLLSNANAAALQTRLTSTKCKTDACTAIYKTTAVPWNRRLPAPADFKPAVPARRQYLHLGDSVLYGDGVPNRFSELLGLAEPGIEHINGAIAATATDVELALARRWVALHRIDAVILYMNPNDIWEIGGPFPCANWQSLMVYDGPAPQLRHATDHTPLADARTLRLLLHRSPPPFLLRIGVDVSSACAHLCAAFVQAGRRAAFDQGVDEAVGYRRIRASLAALRDELKTRHIPLVTVVLHFERPLRDRIPDNDEMKRFSQELGIETLDVWQPLTASLDRGEQPFLDGAGHFNSRGHQVIARWLHEVLPAALERARRP